MRVFKSGCLIYLLICFLISEGWANASHNEKIKKTKSKSQVNSSLKKTKNKLETNSEVIPPLEVIEIVDEPAPAEPLIKEAADYLKSSKDQISDRVIVLANEIDAIFGNTRALNEYYDSTLVLTQKSYLNSLGSKAFDIQSTLNLSLPNLKFAEERIRRWWAAWGEDEDSLGKTTKDEFKELNPWEYNQGIGVRITNPINYNLLARASRNFLSPYFVHHFSQFINWDSARLWETYSLLNSDYALTNQTLFRFWNEANWGISSQTFVTHHGPSIIYNIDKHSVTSFDLRLITGISDNILYTQNYTASINYRTSLHPLDWCYIQFTPEVSWPRSHEFKSVWTIYMTIDMVFGRKK